MELANYIETAMKSILKNPIYEVLSEIKITKILKQSNFVKREVGYPPFQIILHFLYMLIMQKRQSTFIKNSDKAYGKDVYYRFIKEKRYNWRKLLLLSATELLKKIKPLHKNGEYRLLIIDDTVEPKRGKFIEGTCKYIWSNKEHRSINALNIVSLNYADSHSTFQLDFSIKMNDSKRKSTSEFTAKLHHRSNAYQRKSEIIKGKNMLALEMLERALDNGIDADYLLVDSWYAKPNFIKEANTLGMPVIARLPNNKLIWNFKGKYKTLNAIYDSFKNIRHKYSGKHGKISYKYFDSVLEHAVLGKVKLVFLHTGKDLLVFISTDISISGKEILETYKKRWNIEQGYKDLRLLFGLGKEENRIYEALIGKITLSMFTYNIVSYINRIKHEPQTLGELFRDLECELETLAISMQLFIQILTKISEIQNVVKDNKDLLQIIAVISAFTQKELGFMCESWVKIKIKSGNLTKAHLNNKGYNKYLVLSDSQTTISIDEDKYNYDSSFDGLKGFVTNDFSLNPTQIIEHYTNLWHIERAFRISKTDLKIRPIYHRLEHRIYSHILISFVAYTVYKEFDRKLKINNISIKRKNAIGFIKSMYGIVHDNEISLLELSPEQEQIYKLFY